MADSLAPQLMGSYGSTAGATPNLDALAQNGVIFDRAYCNSPLCTPSRASMMTGRYVSEIGAYDNVSSFSSEVPTLNHAFKRAGYQTVLIGKMHFGGYDQYHGFDQRLAMETDYSTGYNPLRPPYDWTLPSAPNPGGGAWMAASYVNDKAWDNYTHHWDRDAAIHKEAIRFFSEKNDNDPPFFCCVSYHHPHNPFYAPKEIRERFRENNFTLPSVPSDMNDRYGIMDKWLNDFHSQPEYFDRIMAADNLRWLYETYCGMVYDLDCHAGEIIKLLKAKGLDKNTIIVFTSDHGDMLGHRGMVQKRCFYEYSVRTPLIFSYPDHFPAGLRVKQTVSLLDLFPTFASLAGTSVPQELPGISLLPEAAAKSEIKRLQGIPDGRIVFAEYLGEGVHAPCFMAVAGNYKYIRVHGFEEMFFDLENDPEELENQIASHKYSGIIGELRSSVLKQFNPDAIAVQALENQRNRNYILEAHKK